MAVAETTLPPFALMRRVLAGSLRDWLQRDGRLWLFVLKTCVSALLALWIAFRLGFDQPSTAMTTVFIVAQPQTGLILAKSFFRFLGTLMGLLVTIALVAGFAQSRELFLLGITLWIGLCVIGASWFRDFKAYAFLLAGYTSCLIGFPAVMNPDAVFHIAVTRVSEILLGVLCVTVISDAIFPEQLMPRLVQTVRGQFGHFIQFLHQAVATPLDRSITVTEQLQFITDVLTLESLRAASVFESSESRIRSDRLRLFNADFMAVSTTLHALQRLAQRLRSNGRVHALTALRSAVDDLGPALLYQGRAPEMAREARDVRTQLKAYQIELAHYLHMARARLNAHVLSEELFDFDCTAELLEQFVTELYLFTDTYTSLADVRTRVLRKAPRLVVHTEPLAAAAVGLRATLVLLVLTTFWIETAWPEGAGAATIASVGCLLFASSPNPSRSVRQLGIGFFFGLIAAYLCGFHVLNQLDGFTQLSLGLLPFMMIGAWLLTQPQTAGIGAGFNIMFTSALLPQNVMQFNAVSFLNNGLAQLIGLTVAGIAFSIFTRRDPLVLEVRLAGRVRAELARACTQPLRQLPHAFDGRLRDLMRQLMDLPEPARDRLLACALSVLELGDALIDLRTMLSARLYKPVRYRLTPGEGEHQRSALPMTLQANWEGVLRSLTRCCLQPLPMWRGDALDVLRRYLKEVEASEHQADISSPERQACAQLRRGLHRLYCALRDDDWYTAFSGRSRHFLELPNAA